MMGRRNPPRARAAWRARLAITSMVLIWSTAASAVEPLGGRPLNLNDCVGIGLERQPAIAAARYSYGAAAAAQQGINGLPAFAGLLSRDLPVRRQQAEWGVNIAAAAVDLAQWEKRYAVARNFY